MGEHASYRDTILQDATELVLDHITDTLEADGKDKIGKIMSLSAVDRDRVFLRLVIQAFTQYTGNDRAPTLEATVTNVNPAVFDDHPDESPED
jgi:enamine deaminase RidA (YjgF/YER057c/UK114 family)